MTDEAKDIHTPTHCTHFRMRKKKSDKIEPLRPFRHVLRAVPWKVPQVPSVASKKKVHEDEKKG
jgi:hypothetical protein